MHRKISFIIGILLMTVVIISCWKLMEGIQKVLRIGLETVGEVEKEEKVVILDAGHGGSDSGKVGINGAKEKEINLKITEHIKELLEKEGVQVVLTREKDEQLAESKVEDLKCRVRMMNDTKPALAVSVHQNSYHEGNVFGAQVFYYRTSEEGKKAAGIIQNALQQVNPENTKKIKANDTYYILKKTEVPTIIVECGFLSNYEEAQKLITEDYQTAVAEAVAEGILSYIGNEKDA